MRVIILAGFGLWQCAAVRPAVGQQPAKSVVLRYFDYWNQRDMVDCIPLILSHDIALMLLLVYTSGKCGELLHLRL